jgi:hypothetical protein
MEGCRAVGRGVHAVYLWVGPKRAGGEASKRDYIVGLCFDWERGGQGGNRRGGSTGSAGSGCVTSDRSSPYPMINRGAAAGAGSTRTSGQDQCCCHRQ